MQAAHDVELGDRLGVSGCRGLKSLFQRHRVGAGCVLLSSKSAQAACRHANIRGIDMAVDVEIRLVAMQALAHRVCHPTHGENIAGPVQSKRVVGVETLTGKNFLVNRR